MDNPIQFKRAALLGLGQMGASLAMALRRHDMVEHLTGYDPNADCGKLLVQQEVLHSAANNAAEAAKDADLIILCCPVDAYGALLQSIAPVVSDMTIISDIGSIKGGIMPAVQQHLPGHKRFVPAHPIAGSEKTGPHHASEDIFFGKLVLVTPDESTDPLAVGGISALWQQIGARVEQLPLARHDEVYVYVSHLPQLLSYIAAFTLKAHSIAPSDDPLFQRFLRISRSEPGMWRAVFLGNSAHFLPVLERYLSLLQHMQQELASGPQDEPTHDMQIVGAALLPRVMASALISLVAHFEQSEGQKIAGYAAGGFIDFTAIAGDMPDQFIEQISHNAALMVQLLTFVCQRLEALYDVIKSGESQLLYDELGRMREAGLYYHELLH